MKYLITFAGVIMIISCDRQLPPAEFSGLIEINGKILNPRDSIGINDTVKVAFDISDTINYNGVQTPVTFSDKGAGVGIYLRKIDTTFPGSFTFPSGSIITAPVGYLNPVNYLTFQKIGNNLIGVYNFIPKSKGVFFLEQQKFGIVNANGTQYQLDFKFTYGNINRNHKMLLDSTKPGFNLFLNEHVNNGWEVYGFRVK